MFSKFNLNLNLNTILLVFVTLILTVVVLLVLDSSLLLRMTGSKPHSDEKSPSAFEKLLKPVLTRPVRLTIESFLAGESHILLAAKVNPVGIENDGSLETPNNWDEAGWYENGAGPGQIGNVLINAHYDDNLGRPAAFWQLKNIKIGDKVKVENEFGKVYTYEITEFFYIDIRDPERLRIFKDVEGKSTITLITCGGVWLPGEGTYNKRLVVKGEEVRLTEAGR